MSPGSLRVQGSSVRVVSHPSKCRFEAHLEELCLNHKERNVKSQLGLFMPEEEAEKDGFGADISPV